MSLPFPQEGVCASDLGLSENQLGTLNGFRGNHPRAVHTREDFFPKKVSRITASIPLRQQNVYLDKLKIAFNSQGRLFSGPALLFKDYV